MMVPSIHVELGCQGGNQLGRFFLTAGPPTGSRSANSWMKKVNRAGRSRPNRL